jgi:hypothetical protein
MKYTFVLIAVCSIFIGCATTGNNTSNERLLAAAGFHLYMPKNPEEENNLKRMPQRRIIYMDKAVKPTYLYADHDECDCVYVGGQKEVDRFQKLATEKENADAMMDQAAFNQNLYGWGGMYGGMGGMYPMGMYGMGGMGVMGGYW